jgi:tripartite-type tricarboxylate transporter receptor subunit TctC
MCAVVAAALPLSPAGAQDFPQRQPVKLIVTFAPGGGADSAARALSDKLGEKLGQSVVVENRPGGGGVIATGLVAKASPDGYSVLFTVSSHSINQAMNPKLPFDTERDLRGVTLVGLLPQAIAVHPSVPANTLQEWLALAKSDARFGQYATGGVGSPGHFAGAVLQSMSGQPLTHVGYKGAGPAMTDVIGNQVPAVLGTLGGMMQHIKAARLKPIAVTSRARSALLPAVGTIGEAFPGFESDTWVGMFVPAGTPAAVIARLHGAAAAALAEADVRGRLEAQGLTIVAGPPADLDALVTREIRVFSQVVKEQGIKAE